MASNWEKQGVDTPRSRATDTDQTKLGLRLAAPCLPFYGVVGMI